MNLRLVDECTNVHSIFFALFQKGYITSRDYRTFQTRYECEGHGFLQVLSGFLTDIQKGLDELIYNPSDVTRRTFRHRQKLPGFLRKLLKNVFSESGHVLPSICPDSLRILKQLLSFFKRLTADESLEEKAWCSLKEVQDATICDGKLDQIIEKNYGLWKVLKYHFNQHYNNIPLPSEAIDLYKIRWPSGAIRDAFHQSQHDDISLPSTPFDFSFLYESLSKRLDDKEVRECMRMHANGYDQSMLLYERLLDYFSHIYYGLDTTNDFHSNLSKGKKLTNKDSRVIKSNHYNTVTDGRHDPTYPLLIDFSGKFCSVPKSFDKDRGISIFPILHTVLMSMINSVQQKFSTNYIPLKSQQEVRDHLFRNFDFVSTIDLKDATNTLPDNLYRRLFKGNKWNDLRAFMTVVDVVYKDENYPLKCQLMGQATGSFMEMSVFLLSLMRATIHEKIDPDFEINPMDMEKNATYRGYESLLKVYGDDMMTPLFYETVNNLKIFGLIPNIKKSFSVESRFKESCGLDLVKANKHSPPVNVTTCHLPDVKLIPTKNRKRLKSGDKMSGNIKPFMRSFDVVRTIKLSYECFLNENFVMADYLADLVEDLHYYGKKKLPTVAPYDFDYLIGRPGYVTDSLNQIELEYTMPKPTITLSRWALFQKGLNAIPKKDEDGAGINRKREPFLTKDKDKFKQTYRGYTIMAKSNLSLKWRNKLRELESDIIKAAAAKCGVIGSIDELRTSMFSDGNGNPELFSTAIVLLNEVIESFSEYTFDE